MQIFSRRLKRLAALLGLGALLALGLHSGALAAASNIPPAFSTHYATDRLGRRITYYVAPAKTGRAPLLMLIQGSGCEQVFDHGPQGVRLSLAEFILPLTRGRFTVMIVEKPYAGAPPGSIPGTATQCSRAFNADFTAERWEAALEAALSDARTLDSVDPGRMLLLGHSEGARMAAMLAGRRGEVTDVALFAMGGLTPYFDMLASAYQSGDTTAERLANMDRADAVLREILAKPDSIDDFAWGHPYRRWSSFLTLSPLDDLRRSRARIYVANGTADASVPFLSSQALVAALTVDRRDIAVRRIPDADHSLRTYGAKGSAETAAEYARALDWFWLGA